MLRENLPRCRAGQLLAGTQPPTCSDLGRLIFSECQISSLGTSDFWFTDLLVYQLGRIGACQGLFLHVEGRGLWISHGQACDWRPRASSGPSLGT